MISNGQYTLRKAGHYLGGHEGAPNRSGAPVIDECQALYGLQGVPWCACFVGFAVANSEASAKYKTAAKSIANPSTQVMADKARAKGWLLPGNGKAKPGDWFIIPGLHVGFVNSVGPGNTFTTIEGNHQDSIASVVRSWSDGWQRISIPDVGDPGPAATVDGYGFDDTRVKLYGGWPTPQARDSQMAKFAAANKDKWTQAVKVAKESPYAFRAGPTGTYSHWQFGPWLHSTGKEIRDEQMKKWQDTNKATARPWRKTYKEA
jgi:hypothetical protein